MVVEAVRTVAVAKLDPKLHARLINHYHEKYLNAQNRGDVDCANSSFFKWTQSHQQLDAQVNFWTDADWLTFHRFIRPDPVENRKAYNKIPHQRIRAAQNGGIGQVSINQHYDFSKFHFIFVLSNCCQAARTKVQSWCKAKDKIPYFETSCTEPTTINTVFANAARQAIARMEHESPQQMSKLFPVLNLHCTDWKFPKPLNFVH